MSSKTHLSQGDFKVLFSRDDDDILTANEVDVGTAYSVIGYSHITGFVFSDVASASPDGIIIEQARSITDFASGAASTEDVTISTTRVLASDLEDNSLSVQIVAPFARIVYVNGATAQTKYRAFFAARLIRGL